MSKVDKCGHGEYLSYRMSTNCAMLILVVTVYCESAIVTVVEEVLPKTVHRICLFHFVQANYRYITENCGLTIPYRDELDIQSLLQRFWALAYLPVISIGLMFPELKDEAAAHPVHSASVLQYADYFERQWTRNRAVPKRMWSVHNVAAQKRTNGDSEAWNSKWNRAVSKAGPGYYETVLQIGHQQAETENIFVQINAGVAPPPRKAKYVKKDDRIKQYLDRWMSPPQRDIDHNDVIDTPRLLHILAHVICK